MERFIDVFRRYGCALAVTVGATAVALALCRMHGLEVVGLLAFPIGVLLAAWLGGMGPGILAAVSSAVAVAFFFLEPLGSLSVQTPRERIALAAFVMVCIVESTLVGTSRRSARGLGKLTEAVAASEEKYRLLATTSDRLLRAKEEAERATKARDRFLVVLSHELRTPLTPALLASTALEARSGLPDDVRRAVSVIGSKVRLEAKLIEDLLDVVRIMNGDFAVARVPVDATKVVGRAVAGCMPDAQGKRIDLEQELPSSARIVAVDPGRLRQAATSLVANAIDAAPMGSTVRVWVRDQPPSEVAIGFSHDGEQVEADRIFDPFERGATPGSPNAWGLGLGLAITKAIAEASGGSIEARFDGKATSVVMRLPASGSAHN
jgi:K+-sensing histidine kinase KdpD